MAWHEGEKIEQVIGGVVIRIQMADRFLSDDCEAGKHEECGGSPISGICGCRCHDAADGSS